MGTCALRSLFGKSPFWGDLRSNRDPAVFAETAQTENIFVDDSAGSVRTLTQAQSVAEESCCIYLYLMRSWLKRPAEDQGKEGT